MYHFTYDLATLINSDRISFLLIPDSIGQIVYDLTRTVEISADDLRFLCRNV